jgi:hypothetical protein
MIDERLAPMAQGSLTNVEANAIEAHGRHEEMHVWVGLIGVQRQSVSMRVGHLLADKAADRGQELLGRGAGRHAKEYLVYELEGFAALEIDSGDQLVQVKVPVFDKLTRRGFTGNPPSDVILQHPELAV